MMKDEFNLDGFSEELAGRFKALGAFFDRFGSSRAAGQLLEALVAGDARTFAKLTEPVDVPGVPKLGKCYWIGRLVQNAIDVVISAKMVETCHLREDLTADERMLYILIALRHRKAVPVREDKAVRPESLVDTEVLPGPFLDELKANGLVTCKQEMVVDHGPPTLPYPAMPQRLCF